MNTQGAPSGEIDPDLSRATSVTIPMRQDSILAELWAVKAELNAAAGYDVQVLLDRAASARAAREKLHLQACT